ncbi:MAG TPA: GNAT family N-acetyltransferase, partial [Acidimicrobiales bacterium]|nr:GNAT family N-acetyltransferase [Acidimicrobiales bacterium]
AGVSELAFSTAGEADVGDVVALVESAYRGEASRAGWTTEADLLDGQRTDAGAVRALVTDPGSEVILARDDGALVACAHLQRRGPVAYFGMFAVAPERQGARIGSAVLAEAERRAAGGWGCSRLEMTVIRQRGDLIAWYQRRGYRWTGETRPFPYGDERYGRPRRPDLEFAVLAKGLR